VQVLLEVGGQLEAALFIDTSRVNAQRSRDYRRRSCFGFHFDPLATTSGHRKSSKARVPVAMQYFSLNFVREAVFIGVQLANRFTPSRITRSESAEKAKTYSLFGASVR